MKVTQINDSWHARSELFPGCSGQGPTRQDAAEQLLLAIEEQFSSGKKRARTRFVRDLVVTRTWGEDHKYVLALPLREVSLSSIIQAWKQQVANEFNEALPDGCETEGASIIAFHTGGDADVSLRSDSDMLWYAEFRVTLDFWYGDLGQSFTNDHDLIQHIFYDEGGVAGSFKLLSPTDTGADDVR